MPFGEVAHDECSQSNAFTCRFVTSYSLSLSAIPPCARETRLFFFFLSLFPQAPGFFSDGVAVPRRFENEFSAESKARMRNGCKNRRAMRGGTGRERGRSKKMHAIERTRGMTKDEISTVDRSEAVKAAAKGSKARSRIAFLKITGTGKLTAGQLLGRKSLGSSSPRDRSPPRKFFHY